MLSFFVFIFFVFRFFCSVSENQREFMHVVDWIPALSLGGADMDAIDSHLQSILCEPMAASLSLSAHGTTNKKSEFLLSTSSKWLIYGNSKDNQGTDVSLSSYGKHDFQNENFDTDNNIYKN